MTRRKISSEKKWSTPTFPVQPDAAPSNSWRAVSSDQYKHKKDKLKKELIKPFKYRHFTFYPCQVARHIKAGFIYYLNAATRSRKIIIEENSHLFKNKEDAIRFVDEDRLRGSIPL